MRHLLPPETENVIYLGAVGSGSRACSGRLLSLLRLLLLLWSLLLLRRLRLLLLGLEIELRGVLLWRLLRRLHVLHLHTGHCRSRRECSGYRRQPASSQRWRQTPCR